MSLHKLADEEPWATTVQSQLRTARLPRKEGHFRLKVSPEKDRINCIYVWRHTVQIEHREVAFMFEFLATHFDLRRNGLAKDAYQKFIDDTYDVLDTCEGVDTASYIAHVHRDNSSMRQFLRDRGWDTYGEYVDDDYMVFVMRIAVEDDVVPASATWRGSNVPLSYTNAPRHTDEKSVTRVEVSASIELARRIALREQNLLESLARK